MNEKIEDFLAYYQRQIKAPMEGKRGFYHEYSSTRAKFIIADNLLLVKCPPSKSDWFARNHRYYEL